MNDIHEDDSRRFFTYRSEFKKSHRELLIGSPYPDPKRGYPQDDYTWAFDFAQAAVRERKRALVEEACRNYDVDGIELDFQRAPWLFKVGREREGMGLLTEMVRAIRESMDRISGEKGRRLELAVRVPRSFARCEQAGLDVRTWIEEDLVDVVVPMDNGYMDLSADVREFVAAARDRRCRVYGGLEHYVRGYRPEKASIEVFRAGAAMLWEQGVDGVYLFNFDCHRAATRTEAYTSWEMDAVREIGDPAALTGKDKHYFVTRDMEALTVEAGGTMPLPAELSASARARSFPLMVSDDPCAVRPTSVELRVTVAEDKAGAVTVDLNGERLVRGESGMYDAAGIRRGENTVTVGLADGGGDGFVRIEGIELFVRYDGSTDRS